MKSAPQAVTLKKWCDILDKFREFVEVGDKRVKILLPSDSHVTRVKVF